jgi:P27 family predicted phage terminase small subunit
LPRTKKPAGTAVDRRNGRQTEVAASSMRKFSLPKRSDGEPWRLETRKAWSALWSDGALAGVLLPVDRPVLLRWADALDRAARHLEQGDENPIATGSMGQQVESPHYGIADKALRVAKDCEAQLGIGALHRARLGIAVLQERASLMDLNARIMSGGSDDDDDPRLSGLH